MLDAYKGLQRFIKPLLGHGDEADKDNEFDVKLRKVWDELNIITPLYDKVRNWLSRKIYNPEKIKLYLRIMVSSYLDGLIAKQKKTMEPNMEGISSERRMKLVNMIFIWVSLQMLSCFVVMKLSVMKMVCMKDLITIT